MKILGITAEYNPFHNGHRYHLQRSMEMTGADYSVAVMSGSFTQRGEPAVLDKWTRSRLAVQNGVDLVLELPFLYACSRGEIFASGAVDILRGIGATHISFGSESGDLEALQSLVTGMRMRSGEIDEIRLQEMQKGDSFARSLQRAVEKAVSYTHLVEQVKAIGAEIMEKDDIYPVLADDNGYKEKEREYLRDIVDEGSIDKLQKKATKYANEEIRRATYQAMEAFVHNLNTMHSRAGAQIPFSSINYGKMCIRDSCRSLQ